MEILKIREHGKLADQASEWFHSKWKVPLEEYRKSMEECMKNEDAVPQWYVVMEGDKLIAGAGVIENDFHKRKDLRPNLCALYVEEEYRCRGIAGKLLEFVCSDMDDLGIQTLYLITGHTSFYERYGWKYLCMVEEEDEPGLIRMYVHEREE